MFIFSPRLRRSVGAPAESGGIERDVKGGVEGLQ